MIKSRYAFRLVMRYLVREQCFTPEFAFKVCSAKNRDELEHLFGLTQKPKSRDIDEIIKLVKFANWVTARSGFDLTDRARKKA